MIGEAITSQTFYALCLKGQVLFQRVHCRPVHDWCVTFDPALCGGLLVHDHHPTHYDEHASRHYDCSTKPIVPYFIVFQDLSDSLVSLTFSRKGLYTSGIYEHTW